MAEYTPAELGPQDLVVLPADEATGLTLVFGASSDFAELGETVETLPEAYARRVAENVGLAGPLAAAVDTGSGRLVRLTARSAAKAKELNVTPDGSGQVLSVFRDQSGQFAHVARFESVPAAVDPATLVAALAVQQVVRQIEAQLEEISQDVKGLVRGAKNELEAEVASALDVLVRIERRVRDRGLVDGDDWASLANLEPIVKRAYHETFRWLDPLREYLADDARALVDRVKTLRGEHGLKDVDFWLRMHIHSELALKRWELLYLIRESDVAPERLAGEAEDVRQRAEERHQRMVELVDRLQAYLEGDGRNEHWTERLRLLSKNRLQQLHHELAQVANAYAAALHAADVVIPAYVDVEEPGPLVDSAKVRHFLGERAPAALQARTQSTADTLGRWGQAGWRSVRQTGEKLRRRPGSDADLDP